MNTRYRRTLLPLTGILLLASVLLVTGLDFGLPDSSLAAHRSSNVGDENAILQDTLSVLKVLTGNTDELYRGSYYFQEGWLGHYVRLGLLGPAYLLGYIQYDSFGNREIDGYSLINFTRVFLVSRLASVAAILGIVVLIYLVTRTFFSEYCALAAAFLFTVLPGPIILGHFSKSNPLAALLATLSLYFALKWYRTSGWTWAFLAGLAAGFAGGSRTNAVLAIIPIGVAILVRSRSLRFSNVVATSAICMLGACVALAISYPHLIADPRIPDYGAGAIQKAGWHWRTAGQLFWIFWGGWPGIALLSIGLFGGILRMIRRHDTVYFIIFAWCCLYTVLVVKTATPQPRYLMPITPAFVILVSVGVAWVLASITSRPVQIVATIGVFMLACVVLMFTVAYVRVLDQKDTAIAASDWLANNAPVSSRIGIACWSGDHSVRIDPQQYDILYSRPHPERPELRVLSELNQDLPDYLVMFDKHAACNRFPLDTYRLVKVIHRPLTVFGIQFDDQFDTDDALAPRWYDRYHQSVFIYQNNS